MKAFLLLVTWLMPGQPPSNYQVAFNSSESWLSVINDAQRIRQNRIDQARSAFGDQMAMALELAAPSVSAVCVPQ